MNQQEVNKFFRWKCFLGLKRRGLDQKQEYIDRLNYELDVIESMGFPSYFLIVCDFLAWARRNGILLSPGRGSGAGSLVAYCLQITQIDPIKYHLYFERFLNPSRISMPDIDCDFADDQRSKVIEYVKQRYGADHVSGIGTYGTMACRGAIKAVARTLGAGYDIGDKISKLTPPPVNGIPPKVAKCITDVPELATMYSHSGIEHDILDWANKIEGRVERAGSHASGILISDRPLVKLVPLTRDKKDNVVSQWDMIEVEKAGLVKFDFLGLTILTVMAKALELIKQRHGITIDLDNINYDDEAVYKKLQAGDAVGLFQIETSAGIRELMVKMIPRNLSDLGALTAIYRPGPLCLSGDTKILTGINGKKRLSYHYKKLSKLYEQFSKKNQTEQQRAPLWIQSLDLQTNELIKTKIKTVIESGIKPVYKINFQISLATANNNYSPNGNRAKRATNHIKASEDHKFLTLNGFKALKDLVPGEYICITHHSGFGRSFADVKGKKNFRNIAFRNYQYKCVLCDWNKGSLDVNHLDGNRYVNNSAENLVFLCPNHHRMYTEGNLNREEIIKAREQYKIPFTKDIMYVRFTSKELIGEEKTYDIEVDDQNHNFIAGDFVVHNSSDMMHTWLKIRAGQEKPTYLVPELKPILEETDGWLVYQEQCMRIAVELAGYTMAEADGLRKAIGKKLPEEMAKHEKKFKDGCTAKGFDTKVSDKLWSEIVAFAAYGFNKSHALAYGALLYQTAYLKTHYPVEYMCAALTCNYGDADQVIKYIFNCRDLGIKVLPPDINVSDVQFTIDDEGNICFGLAAIKNLGEDIVGSIVETKKAGPFKDILDFINRVNTSKLNKRKLESLVLAGALDSTGNTRASMMDVIEQTLEFKDSMKSFESKLKTYNKKLEQYNARNEEIKLAEIAGKKTKLKSFKCPVYPEEPKHPVIKQLPEFSEKELLSNEKELLGFYISGHPVDKYKSLISSDQALQTIEEIKEDPASTIHLIAVPCSIEEKTAKKTGQKMASMVLEDHTGSIGCTAFSKTWAQYKELLESKEPLRFKCKCNIVEAQDGSNSVELSIISINTLQHVSIAQNQIDLEIELDLNKIKAIHELITKFSGNETRVRLTFKSKHKAIVPIEQVFSIRGQDLFLREINGLNNN